MLLGLSLGALSLGSSWVPFGKGVGGLGGPGGYLLDAFLDSGGVPLQKKTKTLNLMSFSMDLLRFKGPKASEIKPKWSLRREKSGEKREKSREEREESATEAKSARSS